MVHERHHQFIEKPFCHVRKEANGGECNYMHPSCPNEGMDAGRPTLHRASFPIGAGRTSAIGPGIAKKERKKEGEKGEKEREREKHLLQPYGINEPMKLSRGRCLW
jgi:hypothetical protein